MHPIIAPVLFLDSGLAIFTENAQKNEALFDHKKFSASLLPQVKFCEANNMSKHAGLIPII